MNTKTILTVGAIALIAVVAYGVYKKSKVPAPVPQNPNATQTQQQTLATTAAKTGLDLLQNYFQN